MVSAQDFRPTSSTMLDAITEEMKQSTMNNILYLDCSSGIAGDMLVAALLDLGAHEQVVRQVIDSLPVEGIADIRISHVEKHALHACDFDVVLTHEFENHDHDMTWLHGTPSHEDAPGHHHGHSHVDHHHSHPHAEHHHDHAHTEHHHVHRGLADVLAIIQAANMTDHARELAQKAFTILADAEAQAHGTTPDKVHFHEVGAVDSIVDIIAASVCLDDLGIERVAISPLTEGRGTIRCAHGIMPIPVPAVVNVVQATGLEMHLSKIEGELVTPTGAALAAAFQTEHQIPQHFAIKACGIGAGERDYACAGVLRAMLLEPRNVPESCPSTNTDTECVTKLECEIDDATGEALGNAMERLYEAGAREVHYLPLVAKKNRPAWQLQVICLEKDRVSLERCIFETTTTIGIRRTTMERSVLNRSIEEVATPFGPIKAKIVTLPDGSQRAYPEFDDVSNLAHASHLPLQDAWQLAQGCCATRSSH